MKKTTLLCLILATSLSAMAISKSKVRTYARFLSDRMAYELDLTPMQYDDCYEINYDFIYQAGRIMDDVVYGYMDAIDRYYTYLDYRNEDLRFVLTSAQYVRFMARDYFYSPIYSTGVTWAMRIYTIYSNRSFYYFDAPSIFRTYRGGHARAHYSNSFYADRYRNHDRYTGAFRISGSSTMPGRRTNDFGINLKQRGGTTYNNYKNPTANNRTQDTRYRDNSGNTNSPQINNRQQTGTGRATTTGTQGNNPSTQKPATTTQNRSGNTGTSSSKSSQRSGQNTGTRGGRR